MFFADDQTSTSGGTDTLHDGLGGYPPIMTVDEAARLLRISRSALYKQVARGQYRRAVKRGKPMRFHRDLLIRECFKQRR